MDIFEFALEKEQISHDFYQELAQKSKIAGLRNIFSMLADEETKHYQTIQHMQQETPKSITQTDVLGDARQVFDRMRDSQDKFKFEQDEGDLYERARQIEAQARDYYLQKEKEVEDQKQKELFHKLAEEEQKHWFIIDNIIDFVKKPEYYLENAEFTHLDNYVPFP